MMDPDPYVTCSGPVDARYLAFLETVSTLRPSPAPLLCSYDGFGPGWRRRRARGLDRGLSEAGTVRREPASEAVVGCDEAGLKTKRRTDGEPKRKEYRMITGCESAQDHQYPHCRRVSNVKSAGRVRAEVRLFKIRLFNAVTCVTTPQSCAFRSHMEHSRRRVQPGLLPKSVPSELK